MSYMEHCHHILDANRYVCLIYPFFFFFVEQIQISIIKVHI